MASVFQKFGGIRPMAAKLSVEGGDVVPPSTVKSWHAKRHIPSWRHTSILEAATRHEIDLTADELVKILPDDEQAEGERNAA